MRTQMFVNEYKIQSMQHSGKGILDTELKIQITGNTQNAKHQNTIYIYNTIYFKQDT